MSLAAKAPEEFAAVAVKLPLRVGARTIGSFRRSLVRVSCSLETALSGLVPPLPALPDTADGYLLGGMPVAGDLSLPEGMRVFERQRYERCYAALDGSFEEYLAQFSSKSRSGLRRKVRKFTERSGGTLDLRSYRSPAEIDLFWAAARQISERSYQERLLDAGLPASSEFRLGIRRLAEEDRVRGWILYLDGAPASYLLAPADGNTLIYAHVGYDPAFADLSPGSVLQFEAMRMLLEEKRFRLFDFTEGDGQHKRAFATASVACADLLIVRPTVANLMVARSVNGFDRLIASARAAAGATGMERLARSLLR